MDELAEVQGVAPVESLESLRADFWPDDLSVDDFLSLIRPGSTRRETGG